MAWIDDISLPYVKVSGKFGAVLEDRGDAGLFPDILPVKGKVTFTPSVSLAKVNGALMSIKTVEATVSEGIVANPSGGEGIYLLATDGLDNVSNWGWTAKFSIDGMNIPNVSFYAPSGTDIDLVSLLAGVSGDVVETVVGEQGPPGPTGISVKELRNSGYGLAETVLEDDTIAGVITLPPGPEGPRGKDGSPGLIGPKGDPGTTADLSTYATKSFVEDKGYVTHSEAEAIALENALLNEDQPINHAEIVDNQLVLRRRDGVELTVKGTLSDPGIKAVWRVQWPFFIFGSNGGWITREGNTVTLRVASPQMAQNVQILTPPLGFRPVLVGDQFSLIDSYGAKTDGTAVGNASHFYGSADNNSLTLYGDVPVADQGTEGITEWVFLVASWITTDPAPETPDPAVATVVV